MGGIRLEFLADVTRISDVHLWPYWSADENVMKYQDATMFGITGIRIDHLILHNVFILGANVGIQFVTGAAGVSTGFMMSNLIWIVPA